jgi:hypothetical protein
MIFGLGTTRNRRPRSDEAVQVASAGPAVPVRPRRHPPAQPSPPASDECRRVPLPSHPRVRGLEAGDVRPEGRIKGRLTALRRLHTSDPS